MKKEDRAILYIDDEKENLEGFKITFYDEYKVYTAGSGSEALFILKENPIQIIISDQRMPEMSGLELLSKINELYPDIVCIILTAYADTDAVIKAVNQGGVYRFLLKPWNEVELRITINNALELFHYRVENKLLINDLKTKNLELLKANQELKVATVNLEEREYKLKEQNEEYVSINEELTQTIEELAKAKEKAEESDRLKKAFLQNMSHEIRTPLNAILGFSNLLKQTGIPPENFQKYTDIIINGGNQLLSIVTDILTISSIDAGQEKINETELNINNFVNELRYMFQPLANQKGLSLYLNKHTTLSQETILTDKTKLQQILTNLITNAIRYTQTGNIEFGYTLKNNFLEFYVKDTGIGIDPDHYNIIFDRFRQLIPENNIAYGGTGLGLAISKAHVELLGGKIWLESIPGSGSTFFFTIPYIVSSNFDLPIDTIKNTFSSNINITVLVAEDEKNNFLYIKELLNTFTSSIIYAQNGLEAITLFKETPNIELVFMDIKMPIIDGVEAAMQIKKINNKVPILALTAFTSMEQEILNNPNFNGYISKPIDKNKLFDLIIKTINLK